MKHFNLLTKGAFFIALFFISSCDNGETEEPTFADPEISITSPTDLSGLQALIGSPFTFTLAVEAEAGLSTVSLDGTVIKTYTGSEKSDSFDYDYIATENGTFQLTFVVEDALGKTSESTEVSIEIVGEESFLIADFGGAEGGSTTLGTFEPDFWDAARNIISFSVSGNLTQSATQENVGNQFAVQTGADNPDSEASLEFQGKAMMVVKQPADWGTEGWGHVIIDLENTFEQSIIEALPQVNEELNGLTAGTKLIRMDAYFDDTKDENMSFDDLTSQSDIWNADPSRGYLVDLTLVNYEVHRLNHDGAGMYIGYQAYIPEPNKWVTISFNALDLGRVGNFFAAGDPGKESPSSDQVDGIRILPGGGFNDGQSANTIYFRNLRIVDID